MLSENTHRCLFVIADRVERRVGSTRTAILILGDKNQQGAASSAGWIDAVVSLARWRGTRRRVRREGVVLQQLKTD